MDWLILILAIIAVIALWEWRMWDDGLLLAILVVIVAWLAWYTRDTPEERAEKARIEAQQRLARETPHVIRTSPDGCQVYAFEHEGRTHYFTRCPATTDTQTNWTENCGKNCTRSRSSNIVTPNN